MRGLAVIATVLVSTLAACSGSTDQGTKVAPDTTAAGASTTTAGSPPGGSASKKIGDKVQTKGGDTVQVFSYGPATPTQFASVPAGGSVTAIDVQGCSSAKGPAASFNPLYFSLKMADNTKADAALGSVDGQIASEQVAPGDCVRGKVGFVVPPGAKPVAVLFQPVNFSGVILRWAIP